jgi:hypothetical protein
MGVPTRRAQLSALTRAIKTGDPEKVHAVCRAAVRAWDESLWPEDWTRWQHALDDVGACAPARERPSPKL